MTTVPGALQVQLQVCRLQLLPLSPLGHRHPKRHCRARAPAQRGTVRLAQAARQVAAAAQYRQRHMHHHRRPPHPSCGALSCSIAALDLAQQPPLTKLPQEAN